MSSNNNASPSNRNQRGGSHFAPTSRRYVPSSVDPTMSFSAAAAAQAGAAATPAPAKKRRGSLLVGILLLVVGLGLIASALAYFVSTQREYSAGVEEYAGLAAVNVVEDEMSGTPLVDFSALQELNSEIVGWVQIPGTPVNYPVCQHADNDYYLEHTFLGNYNLAGSVFMDYRSESALDDHTTVLYGHHLKNGEMFASVAGYSNQENFDQIEDVYYVSDDGTVHVLSPLCCLVVDGGEVNVMQFDFESDDDFADYVWSLYSRSRAKAPDVDIWSISHVYLMSTCSYERENDRTILVCVDWGEELSGNVQGFQSAVDGASSGI